MREGRIGERASIERLLKRESAKLSQGKVRIFAAAACFFDDDEDLLFLFPAPLLRRLFLPPFLPAAPRSRSRGVAVAAGTDGPDALDAAGVAEGLGA